MIHTNDHVVSQENWLMVFKTKKPCPVIISVPHDGFPYRALSGMFEPRKIGYHGRDLNVWPIAKDVLIAANVNAIRGLLPRTLVDYNRAWPNAINYYPLTQKEVHTALDDERLALPYHQYHSTIDKLVERSNREIGKDKTLLIDLHGFAKQPPYAPEGGFDLVLGTGNRASIPHGNIDREFAEYMTKKGYKVFLPKDSSVGQIEDYYSADFTTRHHSEKHDINAIQIEIASRFRQKDSRELGKRLAKDIADFLRIYCLN